MKPIIKLKDYEYCAAQFKLYINNRYPGQRRHAAIEYAACMGVPVVVVYKMMIDLGIDMEYYKERIVDLCEEYQIILE